MPDICFETICHSCDLETLADLIRSSLPEYYDLFVPHDHLLLRKDLAQESEINQFIVSLVDFKPVGIVCFYDRQEQTCRQTASLLSFFRQRDDAAAFLALLKAYSSKIEPIVEQGTYISRFAIEPDWHGRGVAAALLARLEKVTRGQRTLLLHVDRKNSRAMTFYQKNGFKRMSVADSYEYIALKKDIAN